MLIAGDARSLGHHSAEVTLILASLALVSVMASEGPFFPLTVPGAPRADVRRCAIGPPAPNSDCALIHEQWVVTTASAVAGGRPVNGHLRVRIGDGEYFVDHLVHHPKWSGGAKYDVTLMRLVEPVSSFPLLPAPGEFPLHSEAVIAHAARERAWVAHTIGGSPLWSDDRSCVVPGHRQAAFVVRVRALLDGLSGRGED